ncbi:hypothetical protein [Rhodoblastus sp.]|uniref:hypothetical protein n=1 Tax=Rhodoblastus sp. TaxID=1962975 RepID=UPI003F9A11F7
MNLASIVLLGILVVASSSLATYLISVSRERLWLRSKKSEELYHKAEETYVDLCACFRARYELSRMVVNENTWRDTGAINRHIVDLKILVGLYFPSLGQQLSASLAAMATAFDMLTLAEASDETNRDRALHSLDDALCDVKDSFDRFKVCILDSGCVDRTGKIADMLLNRNRCVQAGRVLSVAA